jgi:predicted methyltransferase
MIVVSHFQARVLLKHRGSAGSTVAVTPDLGLTMITVGVEAAGVLFPAAGRLSWEAIEEIAGAENNCFVVEGGGARKIIFFSELTSRSYSLMPTAGAPTMLMSGVPMHRIKGTTPDQDTAAKIRTLTPIAGRVLDTATGLGYTAIAAARHADAVTTIELDPTALEVARLNPWSQALFTDPKIEQLIGDSSEVIATFGDEMFTAIIHDPPRFGLQGDLYSATFYRDAHRVLQPGGRLFHYIGDPESRSGASVTRGVVERLKAAGFRRVERRPEAFGVLARK